MVSTVEGTRDGFHALGLSSKTLAALAHMGFQRPSPVQAALIPPALEGRDCIGNAPTGTGKTGAFLIPLIENIDERDGRPQAVILAPTRELAHQIGREFAKLAAGRKLWAVPVVGGESIGRQIQGLSRRCHIIIATPGRLIDLLNRGVVRLDAVRFVVLDEADRMLDIGFRPDVERIMEAMPERRQTLLLSATMPKGVRELATRYLDDPADVRLIQEDRDATVPAIRQSFVMVHHDRKLDLLVSLLHRDQPERTIVFCRTRGGADKVGKWLRNGGFRAEAIHGDLSQPKRNRVLHGFREGRLTTLVATDVVGRGIDVPGITHVINYDLPEDPENYVHRIGRTGRMGRDGIAYSLVVPDQGPLLDAIEKSISRDLEPHALDGFDHPPRPLPRRGGPGKPRPFSPRGRKTFPPRGRRPHDRAEGFDRRPAGPGSHARRRLVEKAHRRG